MGVPDTYDICANCGEPIKQVNNTGAWIHVFPVGNPPFVPANCTLPVLVELQKSKGGATKTGTRR